MDFDVAKGDVFETNEVVRLTWYQRVQKASWTRISTTFPRLILLLRTDVDCPPDRLENFKIVIEDV